MTLLHGFALQRGGANLLVIRRAQLSLEILASHLIPFLTLQSRVCCSCAYVMLTIVPVFADGVHCLTCAMMLLNTDLHGHVSVDL